MIWDPATQNPANSVGDANGRDQCGNGAFADPLLSCITYQTKNYSVLAFKLVYSSTLETLIIKKNNNTNDSFTW